MKGDPKVIEYLNRGLRSELTAVNQYWLHYRVLEGFANLQVLDPLRIGQTIQEILEADLAAEYDARNLYGEAAAYCESVGDRVSKNLFEELMKDEEGHIDFLETQLNLVEQVGVELYAQKHIGGLESDHD